MPFYRSNYSSDESEVEAVVIDRSPEVRSRSSSRPRREGLTFGIKLSDLFKSRKTRVVHVIKEAPVRRRLEEPTREVRYRDDSPPPRARPAEGRRGREHTRSVRFQDNSSSPSPVRRAARSAPMTEPELSEGFTPLPPKIKKSPSPHDLDEDRGFNVEDRAPKGRSTKSYKHKSSHKRQDSKLDRQPEFIETPAFPRRVVNETDAERARRKQAERDAEHERALRAEAVRVATQNADVAFQERIRREQVEDLGRKFEHAYIEERDVRRNAEQEAEAAKARADDLAKQLDREQREKRYLERKAELLAREKRVAEEEERVARDRERDRDRDRAVLRPVELHQEPRPNIARDPGADAIRRAQEYARLRQQNMRDDDSLFGHQRERRRERRGSQIIFDDDVGRRGHRRQ